MPVQGSHSGNHQPRQVEIPVLLLGLGAAFVVFDLQPDVLTGVVAQVLLLLTLAVLWPGRRRRGKR